MKLSKLLLTTSLCAVVSGPALAQGKPFGEVDADGSGSLSLAELVSVFGQGSAERILARADRNGDGELSKLEKRVRNDDESDDDDEEGDESDESDDEENDSDESDDSDENDEEDDEEDESDEADESDESNDEEDDED